jgi:hypothetical protein
MTYWKELVNFTTDDVSFGVFYDPEMVFELERLGDDDFDKASQIEQATAKRLSVAYNYFDDLRNLIRRMSDDIHFGNPIRDEAQALLDRLGTLLGEDENDCGHYWVWADDGANGSVVYECTRCGEIAEVGGEDA